MLFFEVQLKFKSLQLGMQIVKIGAREVHFSSFPLILVLESWQSGYYWVLYIPVIQKMFSQDDGATL